MTPREIAGTMFFAMRRKRRDAAMALALGTLASRGDPRAVKEKLREMQRD